MLYHVTRGGQSYGPYTLEDLQKYVASGNVLLTDLAKSDEMPDWVPVSQVLGMPSSIPTVNQQPLASAYSPSLVSAYPDAPNLHWGLVLLFGFLTWAVFATVWNLVIPAHYGKASSSACFVFIFVWNLVLAAWLRRVQPRSKALFYYAVATGLFLIEIVIGAHAQVHMQPGFGWIWVEYHEHPLKYLLLESLGLATWIVRLIARFTMRSELEQHFNGQEPVGLSLNGVLTFFFGGIYFQYHLNRINELKRMARYRGAVI